MALLLCCAPFTAQEAHAGWVDDEYADIFVSRSRSKPAYKPRRVAKPKPAVQRPPKKRSRPSAAGKAPKSYRFPDVNAPLYPPVPPLGNSPMFDESLSSALGHYRPASRLSWLQQVYETTGNDPLWHRWGRVKRSADAAIRILAEAHSHGLNPAEYHVQEILQAQQAGDMTLFDLLLTDNVLHYISHLRDGQYSARKVDPRWQINNGGRPDLVASFVYAVSLEDVPGFMQQVYPAHTYYANLRRELNNYTGIAGSGGWPAFPAQGAALKPGESSSEVVALRARLAVTDGAVPDAPQAALFDDDLKVAVERFQRRHGLNDDGIVGKGTRQALAVPVNDRIRQIIASMERWRWLPDNFGKRHIVVNVPAFRLWYREDDVDKLTMRTVVGKTGANLQTPSFSTEMKYLVLNPNWNVPNTILSAEMAPKASRDPGFFRKKGYKVLDRSGNVINPASVNWGQYSRSNRAPYRVVEARGAAGALGTVKFIFPNKHGVYLHDTQSRNLFEKDFRAYSHGCVRIEKPTELGAMLLGHQDPGEFSELVKQSGKDRRVDLDEDIPVYLLYMTAWADDGQIYFYDDLYRRDKHLVLADGSKRG
ncbi:MAG: L,D-transpeptidase family protein [Pseudomonadota bacterium]